MFRQVYELLRPLLRRPKTDLTVMSLLSALAGVFEAAVLVLVVNAAVSIADGTADQPIEVPLIGIDASIGSVLIAAAVLAIAFGVMNVALSWVSAQVGGEVIVNARHELSAAYLGASWERQSVEREGAAQESVTTLAFQSSQLTMTLTNLIAAALGLVGLLVAAVFVDPVVTGVVLVFGLLLFALIRPITHRTSRRSTSFVQSNSRYAEDVARMAAMTMELRVFGVEAEMLDELDRAGERVTDNLRRMRFLARVATVLYRDLAILMLVVAVAVVNQGEGDRLVEVGAVALLVVRSLGYATQAHSSLQGVRELYPNLVELTNRLDVLRASRATSGTVEVDAFDEITLDSVGYSYDDETPALTDVSLTIRRGEVLGVVGPSGSGKSTLMQVLLRLRTPTTGTVRLDGLDYEEIDDGCWARLAALVPQEPQLVEASIADNIAFFRPDVTRSDVERAADDAHVGGEIRAIEHGFDAPLGPRGSGLSGGQKQRVAFARALVGGPKLLILDEPTSALDGDSERRIRETISELKGRVTLVIVAHRLSTLDVCDRVVSMRAGRIEGAELPSS